MDAESYTFTKLDPESTNPLLPPLSSSSPPPFQLVEDWNVDAESYTFTKLDPDDAKDKAIVNKYLLWEGDFGGKAVADGKVFK